MRRPTVNEFLRRCRAQDVSRGRVVPVWAPVLLIGCTVALVPWTVLLFLTLPSRHSSTHWALAWSGFDVGIGTMLAATAVSIARRSVWVTVTATASATLLTVDAWFDVVTAAGRDERVVAVAMAVLCELPLAVICLLIARNVERVLEQARRYALAAGYTVEGQELVPPPGATEAAGPAVAVREVQAPGADASRSNASAPSPSAAP
ncbi:hypothetical protein NBH00_21315 [Paraconexibacter antarcticus]|uniref:Uncharacterized protein n=1 Tax=Paraconexibacter antarcticus TaxID=2949664 RepID=A0ABY5DSE9_9ACTN|nr:hypothetical protein [Paraconexibacter antarcticus]UTI63871.1 hypothetical protein NBH00_21315 [Paraconexibacter antarcticus]